MSNPYSQGDLTRAEELAYKRGFDAGIEWQKVAFAPPKARELAKQLEEMRLRAEGAEARIANVSGLTREELAKREHERGLAEGKALRDELLETLKAWRAQHGCGCSHPACKRCADDRAADLVIALAEGRS